MLDRKNEIIDLLNEGGFSISEPGPLHAPVRSFKIWRDERLSLRLEIEAALDAKSAAPQYPDGTLRFSTDKVELSALSGAKATFSGVETLATSRNKALRETAQFHELRVMLRDHESAAYTVEWLENFPVKYCWPHSMQTIEEDDVKFSLSLEDKGLTVHGPGSRFGLSQAAVRMSVAGHTFYVCGPPQIEEKRTTRSGSIVYVGTPGDLTRKKIRNALSLAFGTYLVETGHTVYDNKWNVVSAAARSAYSLGWRAFDLLTMPLAPLTERNRNFDIGLTKLTRMVERLFAAYEELDLGNLTWAYWHARTATVHIAPAQFGAAIEALQRAYCEEHPDAIKLRIVPRAKWKEIMEAVDKAVADASISDTEKKVITDKIRSDTNRTPQRERLRKLARLNKIEIGTAEDDAWKRRDLAAHGVPIPEGKELEAIQDMKLLMGLFHRLLLSITGAADLYVDYATPGHPWRPLKDPVPAQGTS